MALSNKYHPFANLAVDFIYAYNTVNHPTADFHATTLSNRILYTFHPDLFVKSFIQWNDLEKRFSANVLLGYMYRPGSDIYIVYNEIRDRLHTLTTQVRDRVLLMKITYNLRI